MKNKIPGIVNFAIVTTIVVVSWLFFTVYRTVIKITPETVPDELLTPLNPNLDVKAIEMLKDRFYVDENSIEDTQGTINLKTQSPLVIPSASPNPETQPSPTASPSANL